MKRNIFIPNFFFFLKESSNSQNLGGGPKNTWAHLGRGSMAARRRP
jgi:hypothetical protein